MIYGKYSARGGVKWKVQRDAKLSTVFDMRPHPDYCIFHTLGVNSALIDILFCIGRISSGSSDGSET